MILDNAIKSVVYDPRRRTSTFTLANKKTMECTIRGAIAFPMYRNPKTNRIDGFAIILAQDVRTKVIYAIDEAEFVCIDHVLEEDHSIRIEGLSKWLNDCWAKYYASGFYYHQPHETYRKYALQIIRSKMIQPKPQLIEAPWDDEKTATLSIWERGAQGMFKGKAGTLLQQAINRYDPNNKKEKPPPAVWALMCGLTGMERYPWREPK